MRGETYEEFVDKFKPKKTTDDCYTPPAIYEAIKNWACERYKIDPEKVIRPFWPGENYQLCDYTGGRIVIDNPPFSILAKIIEWYTERDIKFFLFAPTLTCFSGKKSMEECCHIVCDAKITYENGAQVPTSFVTNMVKDVVAKSEPQLTRLINDVMRRIGLEGAKQLPKYEYPMHIVTAAMLQRYARYGVEWECRRGECVHIKTLDHQREYKKAIFGGGLLLSDKAAAERAAAERAAAERAAAQEWRLSDKERELVKQMAAGSGR